MIAVDTNVLVRYLLNDDTNQAKTAAALLESRERFTAPPTVFLELVWVLESCDCGRNDVVRALRVLFGLPNFKPKEPDALAHALRWYEAGMDFGDALHLALSAAEERFVTFDQGLAKSARRLEAFPPISVPR